MADEKNIDGGTPATDKHSRGSAARGNGGEDNPGLITGAPQLDKIGKRSEFADNAMERPTDIGDREAVSPATLDKVYTADSKERWGNDQPSFADQLADSRANEERIRKADAKR